MNAMDESPKKRRKLSPKEDSTGASNPAATAAASVTSQRPARASWLSPTKASIARFNPSLLPRPRITGGSLEHDASPEGRTSGRHRSLEPGALRRSPARLSGSTIATESEKPSQTTRAVSASPHRPPRASLGGGFAQSARRQSSKHHEKTRASEPPFSDTPGSGAVSLQRGHQNLSIQGLVNTPESTGRDTEAEAQAQLASELRATARANGHAIDPPATGTAPRSSLSARPRRPPRSSTRPREEELRRQVEPELPPTPEQLGLKPMPAQPLGLSSSSPAARASKRKGHTARSSPLKPQNKPSKMRNLVQATGNEDIENSVEATSNEKQPVSEVRETIENPEDLEKRATLRRLQDQLQLIQDDASYLERAVTSLQDSGDASLGFVSESKILSLLTTDDPHHKNIFKPVDILPLSHKLAQFLPFSRPQRTQAAVIALSKLEDSALDDAYIPVEAEALAQDLGIEPRLAITTELEIVRESLTDGPLITKRWITIRDPSSLFSMSLVATIDPTADKIANLQLTDLSPWAEPEFGTWARNQLESGDLPSLGRGFATYWRLSVQRAQTWVRCSTDLNHFLHDTDKPNSSGKIIDADVGQYSPSIVQSRCAIHAHLGRRMLQFSHDNTSLLVQWDISCDATGAAQSQVSASCAVPARWRAADPRGSLGLVGPAFRRLVKEKGVHGGVAIMAQLLFGEV